jgi:hypothetical protein
MKLFRNHGEQVELGGNVGLPRAEVIQFKGVQGFSNVQLYIDPGL